MILLDVLIVIWLIITGSSWVYSVRLVSRARVAKAWLVGEDLNGLRLIVADGSIHRGYVRVFMASCMVLMGLDAGVIQFFPPGSDMRTVLSALFRLLFILMALAFMYKAYLENHELDLLVNADQRRRVSRVYQTEHAGDE